MIKAFLFDLNGTMIDDMGFHLVAWSSIVNDDLHAGLSKEEVKAQMYGKNDDLLIRVFGKDHFTQQQMDELSIEKERRYQQAYLPHLKLIDGLKEFLDKAKQQNILLAIGSAAINFNIDFVLGNLNIRNYFGAIVSADDVKMSKPHAETYLMCAEKLGVTTNECIVFEDTPKGVEAAKNAGMKAVVITTMHEKEEFEAYDNVVAFIGDYQNSRPEDFVE